MVRDQLVGILDGIKSGGIMDGHSWLEEATEQHGASAEDAEEVQSDCLTTWRGAAARICGRLPAAAAHCSAHHKHRFSPVLPHLAAGGGV